MKTNAGDEESKKASLKLRSLRRLTDIHLNRRFRSAQAFAVEPRTIEVANAAFPGHEHGAGILDPTRASLWLEHNIIV